MQGAVSIGPGPMQGSHGPRRRIWGRHKRRCGLGVPEIHFVGDLGGCFGRSLEGRLEGSKPRGRARFTGVGTEICSWGPTSQQAGGRGVDDDLALTRDTSKTVEILAG